MSFEANIRKVKDKDKRRQLMIGRAVTLHREGYSPSIIANMLGIGESTVRSILRIREEGDKVMKDLEDI